MGDEGGQNSDRIAREISSLGEQMELLTQVIQYQAHKIKRLEDCVREVMRVMPTYGLFDDRASLLALGELDDFVQTNSAAKGKRKRKRDADDDKPKRKTQYQVFMSAEMKKVKRDHPDIKQTEAFSLAAQNWEKHPDNPKNKPKASKSSAKSDEKSENSAEKSEPKEGEGEDIGEDDMGDEEGNGDGEVDEDEDDEMMEEDDVEEVKVVSPHPSK